MLYFTRGEWEVKSDGDSTLVVVREPSGGHYPPEIEICKATPVPDLTVSLFDGRTIPQPGSAEANARLIAAAPRMWELLDSLAEPRDDYFDLSEFLENAEVEKLLESIRMPQENEFAPSTPLKQDVEAVSESI